MKKIGILTLFYRNNNYGGCLQAYALNKFLRNHNFESVVLSYDYRSEEQCFCKSKIDKISQYSLIEICKKVTNKIKYKVNFSKIKKHIEDNSAMFNDFVKKNINYTDITYYLDDLINNNEKFDTFIVGSDQVWNPNVATDAFFLKGVDEKINRIAYAPSVSRSKLTQKETSVFLKNLHNFDYISVRESSAKALLKNATNKKISIVLDPTFLLNKEEWKVLAGDRLVKEKYALCYLFNNAPIYYKKIKEYCEKYELKMIIIPCASGIYNKKEYAYKDYHFGAPMGPKEFINLIANAEIVFTDSFHGVALSCNLNIDFMLFKRDKDSSKTSKNSRLEDILTLFNLKDRSVTIDQIKDKKPIDFEVVNNIIEENRNESIKFLLNALNEEN